MARPLTVEVAIVGGGPAGLTVAIALAKAGIETALIHAVAGFVTPKAGEIRLRSMRSRIPATCPAHPRWTIS